MSCSNHKVPVVFRPTGFADLAGKRVGIFGFGVEGRATAQRLRGIAGDLVLVDDAAGIEGGVLVTSLGGLEALGRCDVVLKSPGIPRRRSDVLDLERQGVTVTSALNLWLHDVDRSSVVAITGTKGKSTTTALVSFFFHCLGEASLRLGNIGQPPYDPLIDTSLGWLVLEVSSFQCADIDIAPGVVVVTSLGADHLDWHGSLENYHDDKLSLTRAWGDHATLVPDNPTFQGIKNQLGGELVFVAPDTSHLATALGLLGAHSNSNVALALATVSLVTSLPTDEVRRRVGELAATFEPLRGRLTLVASDDRDGKHLRYIDDGLATSVLPAVAALEVFADEPVALIAGGFDRGVDYVPLAMALANRALPTVLLTMGDAGTRIGDELNKLRLDIVQLAVTSMEQAVREAGEALGHVGVVLLSPAAPSFDRYHNWEERSDDFTKVVRQLTN
jgi:UDP-N-acetylmuramoylalanine--D-glutamate ligase